MKTQTEKILTVLRMVSWVSFIGANIIFALSIVTFIISFFWPDANINFKGLITYHAEFRKDHLIEYIFIFSFTLVWAYLNVQIWGKIKEVLYKVNLENPFSMNIAMMLEKIGYLLFSVWLIGFIANGYTDYLSKNIEGIEKGFDTDFSFLFSAGIVYIISQIFKRGVEIQSENELTV
ncbi:MAG: DUF2975 domain-containing protein [Bacteroidota bacterium]